MKTNVSILIFILIITYSIIGFLIWEIFFLTQSFFYILRYIISIIVIFLVTAGMHVLLDKVVTRIRRKPEETIIEHFLFYFIAWIIWSLIDYFIMLPSNIFIFLTEKLTVFLFTLPLIYLYSLTYLFFVREPHLYMDLSGFALAISLGTILEVIFILTRSNPFIPYLITWIIIPLVSTFSIILGYYVGKRRGMKFQFKLQF